MFERAEIVLWKKEKNKTNKNNINIYQILRRTGFIKIYVTRSQM